MYLPNETIEVAQPRGAELIASSNIDVSLFSRPHRVLHGEAKDQVTVRFRLFEGSPIARGDVCFFPFHFQRSQFAQMQHIEGRVAKRPRRRH